MVANDCFFITFNTDMCIQESMMVSNDCFASELVPREFCNNLQRPTAFPTHLHVSNDNNNSRGHFHSEISHPKG